MIVMPRKRFPDEIKIRESAVAQVEAIRLVSFFKQMCVGIVPNMW